jgi:hypothetical protein
MSNLFNSIFNDATATANPLQLMLALLVSLVLGSALTWTYKYGPSTPENLSSV